MLTILLVVHLLIAITMIGLILLQKTEGNASGAGFSGTASVESMMRPRARANPIGQATSVLGLCFFASSIGLALLARPHASQPTSIMQAPISGPSVPRVDDQPAAPSIPTVPSVPNN